jgi:hypothetical protein
MIYKMVTGSWDDCTTCQRDVASVGASVAIVALTVMYMISIIAIVLYIAYTPDRRRVGLGGPSPVECTMQDLELLGGVRLAEESDRAAGLQCTICLCDVEPGEKLRQLFQCKHGFHLRCIDQWLVGTPVVSLSCPLCRANLCGPIAAAPQCGPHQVADLQTLASIT